MTRVLIQPASNAEAQKHYDETIATEVRFDLHPDLDAQLRARLTERYPVGAARMWGSVDVNQSKFDQVQAGDIALFTRQGRVVSAGTIGLLFRSPYLARRLWGQDVQGRVWELMYTLDDLADLDVTYAELNEAIGDAPNNVHMGFRLLDPIKSARCLAGLRLDELVTTRTVTPAGGQGGGGSVKGWNSASGDGDDGHIRYDMPAREVVVLRTEARLVREYRNLLETSGHECGTFFISEYSGSTDLCDRTERVLIEAKGSVERHRIREAIGQLFDYVRFLPFQSERLVVLVPMRPAPDLVQLLDRLGIDLIYRDGDTFTTEAATGAAGWRALLPAARLV